MRSLEQSMELAAATERATVHADELELARVVRVRRWRHVPSEPERAAFFFMREWLQEQRWVDAHQSAEGEENAGGARGFEDDDATGRVVQLEGHSRAGHSKAYEPLARGLHLPGRA